MVQRGAIALIGVRLVRLPGRWANQTGWAGSSPATLDLWLHFMFGVSWVWVESTKGGSCPPMYINYMQFLGCSLTGGVMDIGPSNY